MTLAQLANGQQYSLFGHFHDFPGYYNPSLNKGGSYSEVGLIHRSQWTDLGYPIVNSLFFKYPPKTQLPLLNFRSVGFILQHENYSFINISTFQVFTSNTLVKNRDYSLNVGLNAGLFISSINGSELNLTELSDPEIFTINGSTTFLSRLGFSFESKKLQIGMASSVNSTFGFGDITATARSLVDFRNSKIKLIPALIYRLSSSGESQFEPQVRTVYDRKLALTIGYRQDYGALLQLGIFINGFKGSYGSELPNGDDSHLGTTHELYMSYRFKLTNNKKHERDSILRKQKDSVNIARLDSIRKARLLAHQSKQSDETVNGDEVVNERGEESDSTINQNDIVSEEEEIVITQDVTSIDDLPRHLHKNNTHLILRQIVFETGYDILKPYAYHELDKLVNYLRHNKKFNIEIQGHTDNIGTSSDNNELSYRRALIVYNYLISRDIDASKMKVAGYGEDRPLYPNDTEENRELNRRIEIVFIRDTGDE